jgi:hypothetical protein
MQRQDCRTWPVTSPGNAVVVSWPNTALCTFQQSSDLTPGSWATSGYTITTLHTQLAKHLFRDTHERSEILHVVPTHESRLLAGGCALNSA